MVTFYLVIRATPESCEMPEPVKKKKGQQYMTTCFFTKWAKLNPGSNFTDSK